MKRFFLSILLSASLVVFTMACNAGTDGSSKADEVEKVEATEASAEAASQAAHLSASFKNLKGDAVKLADFKGKVVVMNFWATWCPPCIIEMPSLDKLAIELKDNDKIAFMAVEVDMNIKKAEDFMKKNKFSLPLYTLNGNLPAELESSSIPMTVILDKNGEIVAKHTGMLDFGAEKIKENLVALSNE